MTKRLDITARQVAAICEGAKKADCIPEIKIGNAYTCFNPCMTKASTALTFTPAEQRSNNEHHPFQQMKRLCFQRRRSD
ncbi:hypothetical protein [Ochrobactrum sp. MYb379]|uniref:hypothetical protein n=1 Tax=Ochrobactrum sp. MYb379 TaxID=2745275 RepID=UPI0030A2C38D